MYVKHRIFLDITNRNERAKPLDMVREDTNCRKIEMVLQAGLGLWSPPEGTGVLIRYQKADGTGGEYDTLPDGTRAWEINGCTVSVLLAPQVLTVAGEVELGIILIHGDSRLNTFPIRLNVIGNVPELEESEDYFSITGFIPQPETAETGQYLEVSEVDESGKIRAVRAVEAPAGGGEMPENVVVCDLEGAAEDESTIPLNADTFGGALPSAYMKVSDLTPVDFTSSVSFVTTETPFRTTRFIKIGNMVHIHYVGASKTHTGGQSFADSNLLFTIPEGYRPYFSEVDALCIKFASAYGEVILKSDGTCYIYTISSSSVAGRILFTMSYVCENTTVMEVSE